MIRVRILFGVLGLTIVGASCSHAPPATSDVAARVDVAPGITRQSLGRVAVRTFDIDSRVRPNDRPTMVMRRRHADTMDATSTFTGVLNAVHPLILDRQVVDKKLRALRGEAAPQVADSRAPTFGKELGAKTLIVGQYRFEASGRMTSGRENEFLRPDVVHRQALHIRGFELETGQIIFDMELALDEPASKGQLQPRSLARAAAKQLLARLPPAPQSR
ncbi:MAG: hypothetical protein AAFV29_01685 [Myxococcota bacterium]